MRPLPVKFSGTEIPGDDDMAKEIEAKDHRRADEHETTNAHTTYEVTRRAGEDELRRSTSALAWSGLAAGLSMGLSMLAESLLKAHLPEAAWTPLVTKIGYPVGFLAVILGTQQLFTETTLTAVIPVLAKRSVRMIPNMLRMWTVVLLANLIGALLFALAISTPELFPSDVVRAFDHMAKQSLKHTALNTFMLAIFAGWIIALMAWMLPAASELKFFVIITMTYVIGIAGFPHVIAGAATVFYAGVRDLATWSEVVIGYILPAFAGNTIGGVALVAALAHAQVVAGE